MLGMGASVSETKCLWRKLGPRLRALPPLPPFPPSPYHCRFANKSAHDVLQKLSLPAVLLHMVSVALA